MRAIVAVCLTLFQIGCQYDLSAVEPYESYVKKDVTLLESMKCYEHGDGQREEKLILSVPKYQRSGITDLPVGTLLHVSRVQGHSGLTPMVTVYGTGIHPHNQTPFEWRYQWGIATKLFRAPWENPMTTPEVRYFEKGGRVVIVPLNDETAN
jgi:hypothetical protein